MPKPPYGKWWVGELCRQVGHSKPFKKVADVRTYGPPSFVYGTAELVYYDGTREMITPFNANAFRPRKKDVEVLSLVKYAYKGCNPCPLLKQYDDFPTRGGCITEHSARIKIKIMNRVSWENWGKFIPVFNIGDVVDAAAVIKDNVLYCCGAESTLHSGVKDYIMLEDVEVQEVTI